MRHQRRPWTGAVLAAGVLIQAVFPRHGHGVPVLTGVVAAVVAVAIWWLWQRPGRVRDVVLVTACLGGAAMPLGMVAMVATCVVACVWLCAAHGDGGPSGSSGIGGAWVFHLACTSGMLAGMFVGGHHHWGMVAGMALGAGVGAGLAGLRGRVGGRGARAPAPPIPPRSWGRSARG